MKQKINNYEDVCKFHGITTDSLPDVSNIPEADREAVICFYKMMKTVDAINDGEKLDWNNRSQRKYEPIFDMEVSDSNPSGFGFSYSSCDFWITYTTCGSRLCYTTREKCEHGAKVFEEFYRGFMVRK